MAIDLFFGEDLEASEFQLNQEQFFQSQQQIFSGLQQDFQPRIEALLGFDHDESGNLIELTDEQRLAALPPESRNIAELISLQSGELRDIFSGDFNDAITAQRSRQRADVTQEAIARRLGGSSVFRSDTERGIEGLVGLRSTSAIQTVNRAQEAQDVFGQNRLDQARQTGFQNVFSGTGILRDVADRERQGLLTAPSVFNPSGGGGLLAAGNEQSLFNAQQQANALSGLGSLGGTLLSNLLGTKQTIKII